MGARRSASPGAWVTLRKMLATRDRGGPDGRERTAGHRGDGPRPALIPASAGRSRCRNLFMRWIFRLCRWTVLENRDILRTPEIDRPAHTRLQQPVPARPAAAGRGPLAPGNPSQERPLGLAPALSGGTVPRLDARYRAGGAVRGGVGQYFRRAGRRRPDPERDRDRAGGGRDAHRPSRGEALPLDRRRYEDRNQAG